MGGWSLSHLSWFPAGTHFKRIIPDDGPAAASPEKVKRVIFCSGKIYYELTRERKNRGMDEGVAVVRIEQVTSPGFGPGGGHSNWECEMFVSLFILPISVKSEHLTGNTCL